jgi:hypothetical protein
VVIVDENAKIIEELAAAEEIVLHLADVEAERFGAAVSPYLFGVAGGIRAAMKYIANHLPPDALGGEGGDATRTNEVRDDGE